MSKQNEMNHIRKLMNQDDNALHKVLKTQYIVGIIIILYYVEIVNLALTRQSRRQSMQLNLEVS